MTTTHVHVFHNGDCEDPIFVFERDEDCKAFAATYEGGDTVEYGETPIITPEIAAQMIAERQGIDVCYIAETPGGKPLSEELASRSEALEIAFRNSGKLVKVRRDESGTELDRYVIDDYNYAF